MTNPLNVLRHHVSGAIARGEKLPVIEIQTDADFTPPGKRKARWVKTTRGIQFRWYVGGKLFRKGAPVELTAEWLKAGE